MLHAPLGAYLARYCPRHLARHLAPTKILPPAANKSPPPFGAGRPYSARQIDKRLRSCMFNPLRTHGALYFPPSRRPVFLKAAGAFEKLLPRFKVNAFAGALLIEASKQVYAISDRGAYMVKARRRRARAAVALGSSTVAGGRGRRIDGVLMPAQHNKCLDSH